MVGFKGKLRSGFPLKKIDKKERSVYPFVLRLRYHKIFKEITLSQLSTRMLFTMLFWLCGATTTLAVGTMTYNEEINQLGQREKVNEAENSLSAEEPTTYSENNHATPQSNKEGSAWTLTSTDILFLSAFFLLIPPVRRQVVASVTYIAPMVMAFLVWDLFRRAGPCGRTQAGGCQCGQSLIKKGLDAMSN